MEDNLARQAVIDIERRRLDLGLPVSRCYLMRVYQVTDATAREIMFELFGDDRQSTAERDEK